VTIPADKSVVIVRHHRPRQVALVALGPRATDAPKTATTNQSIDLLDQDGVISVAATQAVADTHRLVVKISHRQQRRVHRDQYFSRAPTCSPSARFPGQYVVTVEGDAKEMARRYVNVKDGCRHRCSTSAKRPSPATPST
jgi:hypothetical protein